MYCVDVVENAFVQKFGDNCGPPLFLHELSMDK